MLRRNFLKLAGAIGAGLGLWREPDKCKPRFERPIPENWGHVDPFPVRVQAPWRNPVDALIATMTQVGRSNTFDLASFDRVWQICEQEHVSYILPGETIDGDMFACLDAAGACMYVRNDVFYLERTSKEAGCIHYIPRGLHAKA